MDPKSDDFNFLAQINAAIYSGMASADPQAIWVFGYELYCFFNQIFSKGNASLAF
jgi:hypothetical protein